jgi:carbon monoxide dehydrogenase subunit G
MPRLQREIVIGAPPEAVFAYLAQPERLPEWTPGVISVKRTGDGPVGVGTTTEALVEAFGIRQTLLGRCTVFEPPRRLVVENVTARSITVAGIQIGQVASTSASELLPEGAGTRVRASLEYTISAGFLTGVAEGAVRPQMQADFDRSLQNLKRLLENAPSGG